MTINQTPSTSFLSNTSIAVPSSANFIGSSEDAIFMQSVVLISTTDRLRDNIRRNVSAAGKLVEAFNTLASKLSNFARVINNQSTAVTYDTLREYAKDANSLRSLFAKDGPNLGDSLAASNGVLADLTADGILLTAPKQTPVMVEQFAAVSGKIDFASRPVSGSVNWRSDQDIVSIGSGMSPGSYAGSLVKTVEVYDAKGNLVSATRYTVFADYANLRPKKADLEAIFSSYIQKFSLILSDLDSVFSNIAEDTNLLDERIRQELSKTRQDQQDFLSVQQDKFTNLVEINRLLKLYRSEIQNTSSAQMQKKSEAVAESPLPKKEKTVFDSEKISQLASLVDALYMYTKNQVESDLSRI